MEHEAGSWVEGALLSQFAAVLTTLGYVFTRRAFTSGQPGQLQGPSLTPMKSKCRKFWQAILDVWRRRVRGGHQVHWSSLSQAHMEMDEEDNKDETKKKEERKSVMSFKEAFRTPDLWWSFLFRGLGVMLWWKAGCMAPVTTVAPLFLLVSLFSNMVCGPAMLQEQYRSREVYLGLSLLLLVLAGACMESKIIKDSAAQRPWITVVDPQRLQSGEAFFIAMCIGLLLIAFAYYGWTAVHYNYYQRERFVSDSQPFDFYSSAMRGYSSAIPVLCGLLSGATYFEGYLGLPVCNILEGLELNLVQVITLLLLIVPLAVCSLLCSLEGAKYWDCRYFVPFSSTVGYLVATSIRILLVEKLYCSPAELALCFIIHIVLVCIPFFCIDRRPAAIQLPNSLKQEREDKPVENPDRMGLKSHGTVDLMDLRSTPLLEMERNEESHSSPTLQSLERSRFLKVTRPQHKTWAGDVYDSWCRFGLWIPIFAVGMGLLPLALPFLLQQRHSEWPTWIAAYCILITGTTKLRTAVFSSVARSRIRLSMQKSYISTLEEEERVEWSRPSRQPKRFGGGRKVIMTDPWESATSSSEDETVCWRDFEHFVVVETGLSEACNSEEVRSLLQSISASPMAAKQISVFLVVRGAAQAEYKQSLPEWIQEFGRKLKLVELLHFESKAAVRRDSKSMVSQLLQRSKKVKVSHNYILVTRTTVESWFHHDYFSAVTFAFLNNGKRRNFTIYQPPIFFLKDYHSQNWLTRYATLFMAQSSLASLTDPMGMPLPKSTFTMVLALMQNIGHSWDPNLSVKPYNIGIWTKGWIGTVGRVSLQPVFLPVYRSGCNPVLDDTFTRGPRPSCLFIGKQMHGPLKAQALSVLELVHMWAALPLPLVRRRESSLQKRRIVSLLIRSVPPFGSVFWAHTVLSSWFLVVLSSALGLLHGRMGHWPPEEQTHPLNWDVAFLLGTTALLFNLPLLSVLSHVDLLKLTDLAGSSTCQYVSLTLTAIVAGPLFHCLTWIEECRLALTLTFAEESNRPCLWWLRCCSPEDEAKPKPEQQLIWRKEGNQLARDGKGAEENRREAERAHLLGEESNEMQDAEPDEARDCTLVVQIEEGKTLSEMVDSLRSKRDVPRDVQSEEEGNTVEDEPSFDDGVKAFAKTLYESHEPDESGLRSLESLPRFVASKLLGSPSE